MEIDQLGRLRDILDAARLIGSYVKSTTESDFYADKQKQDAVIRRIEIIGEAAAHVSAATRQAVPELATVYVPEIFAASEKVSCPPELDTRDFALNRQPRSQPGS